MLFFCTCHFLSCPGLESAPCVDVVFVFGLLCSRVVFFLFAFCACKVLFVVTLVRSHLSSLTHGRVVALLGTTVSECLRESSLRLCPEDFLRCSLLLNPDVSPLGFSVSQFCLIANRATSVLPDPSRRAGPHPGLSRGAP